MYVRMTATGFIAHPNITPSNLTYQPMQKIIRVPRSLRILILRGLRKMVICDVLTISGPFQVLKPRPLKISQKMAFDRCIEFIIAEYAKSGFHVDLRRI